MQRYNIYIKLVSFLHNFFKNVKMLLQFTILLVGYLLLFSFSFFLQRVITKCFWLDTYFSIIGNIFFVGYDMNNKHIDSIVIHY